MNKSKDKSIKGSKSKKKIQVNPNVAPTMIMFRKKRAANRTPNFDAERKENRNRSKEIKPIR